MLVLCEIGPFSCLPVTKLLDKVLIPPDPSSSRSRLQIALHPLTLPLII